MSDERPPDVLGSLPRTRPHRRSRRRETRPAAESPKRPAAPRARPATRARTAGATGGPRPDRLRQPAQPEGTPQAPRWRKPLPPAGTDVVGTAVRAAAELAEIGLSVSARVLRNAVSRLPRP